MMHQNIGSSVLSTDNATPPSCFIGVCHPQRPQWAAAPHPPPSPGQQICHASRPFAWYSQPGPVKQEADSRQEVKPPAICQRGTHVKMSGPGTFPRAAGLLAKETRRMVEAGACCHRRDNLPKTDYQELPLLLFETISFHEHWHLSSCRFFSTAHLLACFIALCHPLFLY